MQASGWLSACLQSTCALDATKAEDTSMIATQEPKPLLQDVFISRRSELRYIAMRVLGHADLVDDVLQDAYLKLIEGVCAREVLNPFGYCCQVVRNMALDYCRRRVVETGCITQTVDGDLPDISGGVLAEAGIDERRMLVRVEAKLRGLPERTRTVFELYRLQGHTQREIGKMLGVSATLVNFMIKDAMQALAACREPLHD